MNSEAETIINESDIDDIFKSVCSTVISHIQKYLGWGSVWTIDFAIDDAIDILMHNPLAGSSYIKLPKGLHKRRKDLINVENIFDN